MRAEDNRAFESSWRARSEARYSHFTRGEPENQIQLAFRQHWSVFRNLMNDARFNGGRRVLEVGSGRGSLSCYFADEGFDCTLLDLSPAVLDIARDIFHRHGLKARFQAGDAEALPFAAGAFDLVFSIGLLEHLPDPAATLAEQVRVLAPGGLFIAYVVPDYRGENVQRDFAWINEILKGYAEGQSSAEPEKAEVFRSDAGSSAYLPILERLGLIGCQASGIYPVPMISHSVEFPFSLMPPRSERAWVTRIQAFLADHARRTGRHPWLCEEGLGNAFLVWGFVEGHATGREASEPATKGATP